jgi:hypothetical protein
MFDTGHMYFDAPSAETIGPMHTNAIGSIERCRDREGFEEAGDVATLMLGWAPAPLLARVRRS